MGTLYIECVPIFDDEFTFEVTDPARYCTIQQIVQTDLEAPLLMLLATVCVAICTSGLSNSAQNKGIPTIGY